MTPGHAVAPDELEGRLMDEKIRSILAEYGHLPFEVEKLRDEDDLYQAGMTSHASVNVMLALEDEFDVNFRRRCCEKHLRVRCRDSDRHRRSDRDRCGSTGHRWQRSD